MTAIVGVVTGRAGARGIGVVASGASCEGPTGVRS